MLPRTVVVDEVKGRDLPPEWASKAGVGPDDLVSISVGPSGKELAAELKRLMDRISAQIKASGVKPEDIRNVIPDFPLELLKD